MANYNFRLICKECYGDLRLHDIHNSLEEVTIFIHPCKCVDQQPLAGGLVSRRRNDVKMDYSKLADEFIEEGAWLGVSVIAVRGFAKWIEEREATKHRAQHISDSGSDSDENL